FENNDAIIIPGHSFVTGQQVYYSSGLSAALGGLVNGQTYWVIRIDANRIRLADSYCHAMSFTSGDECYTEVTTQEPKLDGDGNPVLDENGDPVTEAVTVRTYIPQQHLALSGDNSP